VSAQAARPALWLALLTPALAVSMAMAASSSATAVKPRTVGELGQRDVPVRSEAPVPASASKAMQNYQQFLELQNTDPKLRAQALRRLGDLNLESGELERLSTEVSAVDLQGAEAIRLYTTLLRAFPNYERNDEVLYQLARAYETTGQNTQALATLNEIVRNYPRTREIGEVQFRRGEILFSAKRYADAQVAYQAVVDRGAGGSNFFNQSLYKHGWSLFKQGLNEESLGSFARVLDQKLLVGRNARNLDTLSRADRELVDDTLRVTSIAFSYLDGPASVNQLMKTRGESPYAWLLYSRLGDLYVDKERYQDAAGAYRAFVARDPVDEHAPNLSMQAIEAYRKGGFTDLVVEGKTEYVNAYGFGKPFWAGRDRTGFPQVVTELRVNLKDLAQHHHAQAQKSKKPEDYAVAARWYDERMQSFPEDADIAETNYLLAEVLFEGHQYQRATDEYERTAYTYPLNARSPAAGYAALVAYQRQEETLPAAARGPWHARAIDSGLKFAERFPDHPEAAGVQTRAAQDLFAAKDLERAVQVSQQLLARTPAVDQAKQRIGWTIIGQSRFEQAQYEQSEAGFSKALAATASNQPEYGDLTERLAAAVYRQGDAKRKAGDDAGAADDFLRVARLTPNSKVVPTSRYDAAAALVASKQWPRAITTLEDYRRDYPKSEFANEVTRKLAVAYVEGGKPAQAAVEFERIAQLPGEDPAVVREALTRAADLYETAGNGTRSVALLEQMVQKYPAPVADAIELRWRLAEAARKGGNAQRQAYWSNEIIRADATAGNGRTDRTRYLAAHARLVQVTPVRDAFRAVKLSAPLKTSLLRKRKALELALAGYKEVAAYSVADTTTAANFEMAELYRGLAKDLMASERPKKLSKDEREEYDSLLEEQAFPIEEQAIGLHELNAVRTVDGLYDESVQKSFAALAELKPGRYGKSELSVANIVNTPASAPDAAVLMALQSGSATDGAPTEAALRQLADATPPSAAAASELGILLRRQGKFSSARTAYEQAIAADANFAPAHRNLAVLLDLYMGQSVAALPEFEKYRELTGEEKPVSGWIAELRSRTGQKAAPAPGATP
jgi:tetratricopeptide (TPR) repeat protein